MYQNRRWENVLGRREGMGTILDVGDVPGAEVGECAGKEGRDEEYP